MNAGRLLILAICVVALGIVPASATVVIDFSGGAGGSITAGASTATGSSILIDTITGIGTPSGSGGHAVTSGSLSFSATGGSFNAGTDTYTYTGGTFTISGTCCSGATGTLLSGTISSMSITPTDPIGLDMSIVGNNISSALAAFFGVPTGPLGGTPVDWEITNGTIHLTNYSGNTNGGTFSASTFSTDLPDTPVPEPTSILLLGTILVGATTVIRRRHKA